MFCKNCAGKVTTMLVNRCNCGNEKNSAYKYCEECSRRLGVCELCGKKMIPIKKYRLTVSKPELKILKNALDDWLILTRHTRPDFSPPPTDQEKQELLRQGENLRNRIQSLLSKTEKL